MAIGAAVETASTIVSIGSAIFGGGPDCSQAKAVLEGRWSSVDMECDPSEAREKAQKVGGIARENSEVARKIKDLGLRELELDNNPCLQAPNRLPLQAYVNYLVWAGCGGWGGAGSGFNPPERIARSTMNQLVQQFDRRQQVQSSEGLGGTGTGGLGINFNDPVVLLAGGALIFLLARG